MTTVATDIGFLTVKDVAADLGVTDSRVRQLIMELRDQGESIGQLVGTVRLLSHADVLKIVRLHDEKRGYEKS